MALKTLQTQYIQKSRLFLYPLLTIKRGVSVTPIQTYMAWEGHYTVEDLKLIGVYHIRTDIDFKLFEQEKLLGNRLFDCFYNLEDDTGAYVFDLSIFIDDYKRIVDGKYSKICPLCKDLILDFFKSHQEHLRSYLYPEEYMVDYARLFTVRRCDKEDYYLNLASLRSVGELCSLPDLFRENLITKEKNITFEADNSVSETNNNSL